MQTSALQDAARIASRGLYRSLVRECRRFPDVKTRTYFIEQARADLSGEITSRCYAAQQKHLRWMQAANAGYLHAVQRCMQVAHGQRGKARRRKIEELLQDARDPDVAPLQPGNPRTRPPVYPPRLHAYLTSSHSFLQGKAPTSSRLEKPLKLPERADPNSEEARLLGRLSPWREANIKWRALTAMRGRLIPPSDPQHLEDLAELSQTFKLPEQHKLRDTLPEQLQDRFGEQTRRERKRKTWSQPKRITARFMRRRYEQLLDTAIYLDASMVQNDGLKWKVKPAPGRKAEVRRCVATEDDQGWTPPV